MTTIRVRKRPIEVEAEQYSHQRHLDEGYVPWGVTRMFRIDEDGTQHEILPVVNTLEGTLAVTDGDWIIKGIKGEFYPCKPDIFEETYEILS